MPEPKIRGVKIQIGDKELVVPPLNFRQLEEFGEKLTETATATSTGFANLRKSIPIIAAAINRNYPDMTEEEIVEGVDLGNYCEILQAIMGVSGIDEELMKKYLGVVPGESKPATASRVQ